jgi:hypothetical protein
VSAPSAMLDKNIVLRLNSLFLVNIFTFYPPDFLETVLKIKALKGFKDILPGEVELWKYVEDTARDVFQRFNFS